MTQRRLAIPFFGTIALLVATSALASEQRPAVPSVPAKNREKVELVFVLDTTGSMGGLIDGAKRKIWFIANEVLSAQQRPELRVGLVAYRDKGDQYVTQIEPLTTDIDKVYSTLMGLKADGGGDGPEHVNAALAAAVNDMSWSQDNDTLKMVFLVGDAPPHMDYGDDIKHTVTSRRAVRNNVYINTIQCGVDAETTAVWKQIANNSEGRFAAIPQDGGVVAVATPFDAELGRLAGELDRTELSYGSLATRAGRRADKAMAMNYAAAAPASTAADRAIVKSKIASADADLVARVATAGEAAMANLADEELPDELVGKSKAEQTKIVKDRQEKRALVSKQIAEIEKKRADYLKNEAKKSGGKKDGFDARVVETIKLQAKAQGIVL